MADLGVGRKGKSARRTITFHALSPKSRQIITDTHHYCMLCSGVCERGEAMMLCTEGNMGPSTSNKAQRMPTTVDFRTKPSERLDVKNGWNTGTRDRQILRYWSVAVPTSVSSKHLTRVSQGEKVALLQRHVGLYND